MAVARTVSAAVFLATLASAADARADTPLRPVDEPTWELDRLTDNAVAKADPSATTRLEPPTIDEPPSERPTPLSVDYAQYGIGIGADILLEPGPLCPTGASTPCIIESGGGVMVRGGYRPSGPWYFGGAYGFSKLDSNNLFRLGILQQLRGEARYFVDFGSRVVPYFHWGLGTLLYGNEWSADTGGFLAVAGGGVEFELTRFAVIGLSVLYQPTVLVGYTDDTGQARETGISQFFRLELNVELRSELGRE